VPISGDAKNFYQNLILFFQITYKQKVLMLRLHRTTASKSNVCVSNYHAIVKYQ